MPYKKREVRGKLITKFHFEEVPGSKHEAVSFLFKGKKVATTRFSRKTKGSDIDDYLLKQMAIEIRVNTLNFFKGMIDCTNTKGDFLKRLQEGGFI
jgi:hypothetical protein